MRGLLDSTIWIITADHGELFHEHGFVTHGRTLFDGESRVNLLVHWPDKLKPRDVYRAVSTLDVLPTVADLLDIPGHPSFQGQSLLGDAEPRAVMMNIQGARAVRGMVCWPYKIIDDRSDHRVRLYDLLADPAENNELAASRPELRDVLLERLRAFARAQLRYHSSDGEKSSVFAPRLPRCGVARHSPAASP